MRQLTSHKVPVLNALNEAIEIEVLDEPGPGNACHVYQLSYAENPHDFTTISFQKGPVAEVGVNGVSIEALLAICEDRLAGFQSGPFACTPNAVALDHVRRAMSELRSRTETRIARGVEGTNQL